MTRLITVLLCLLPVIIPLLNDYPKGASTLLCLVALILNREK